MNVHIRFQQMELIFVINKLSKEIWMYEISEYNSFFHPERFS